MYIGSYLNFLTFKAVNWIFQLSKVNFVPLLYASKFCITRLKPITSQCFISIPPENVRKPEYSIRDIEIGRSLKH